jgi:hypothetical protein
MGSDASKTAAELDAFRRFIEAEKYPIDVASIKKLEGSNKPDFFCRTLPGEELAFEVTALCAEDLARMIARAGQEPDAFTWTSDPTERIVRGKMHKSYDMDLPIELLCYWDGRTVSTDDMIVPTIEAMVNSGRNPFRRVWYHGEEDVHLVYGAR